MHNDSNLKTNGLIKFDNVSKVYGPVHALRNCSMDISQGEFVIIVGPSGEGKSTILKIIAGLEKETAGKVTRPMRVAMSFQSAALFPWLTVEQNVAFGLQDKKISKKEMDETVKKYIALMNLIGSEKKRPSELSGGQAQRVGIARALAVDPDVLLLDEPFSALDAKTTFELHADLIKIWQATHKTIVMVSHIIEEAVSLADRVLLVKKGHVEAEFIINFPYPRREQAESYMHEVQKIRNDFFKN
jgi:ABC-type nitrate/sulfonate/bicarbonate transport system ATPase subunit